MICLLLPLLTGTHFDAYIFSFADPHTTHMNIIAILTAILIGSLSALTIRPHHVCSERQELVHSLLSDDEQQLMTIVEETQEITQDSLIYRLEWSRAKVSTIVTNLERRNLIQRHREGKTYTIHPTRRSD